MRRVKEEALKTRKKLIESAMEIMSEKPFPNISMTEIARRIGLSKGAIYWHFKNKNDVLISVIENMCAQAEEELCAGRKVLESIDGMRAYFKNKMGKPLRSEKFKKIYSFMLRKEEWPQEVREKVFAILLNRTEQERQMVERLLVRSQEGGVIRRDVSPRDLSLLITVIFHGIFMFQVNDFYHVDFTQHTDFIFDALGKELVPKTVPIIQNKSISGKGRYVAQ